MAKKGKDGGKPQEVDVAADPNLLWRFAKTSIAAFGNDVGGIMHDVRLIQTGLQTLERFIGGEAVGWVINFTAATVQEPEWLKKVVSYFGLPRQVNELIEEFIDDTFEGLRMKYNEHGRLTQADAGRALEAARSKLRERLEQMTFVQVMMFLDAPDQASLSQRITAFTQNDANKKRFEAARLKIHHPRILRTLIKLPLEDWPGYLDQLYGAAQPAQTSGILRTLESIGRVISGALENLSGTVSPEEKATLDERQRDDRAAIEKIRQRRQDRSW